MELRCFRLGLLLLFLGSAGACGHSARLPVSAGIGPHPELPAPEKSLLPLVNVVSAKGWSTGQHPAAAEGLSVVAYAAGLDHPRWIYVLPNGDVLVAETNAPPRPEDAKGLRGWFFRDGTSCRGRDRCTRCTAGSG